MLEDLKAWPIAAYPEKLVTPEQAEKEAWPCGFIAKFFFSDVFTTVKSSDRSFSVVIDDSDIAHDVDIDKRFIKNDKKWDEGMYWRDVED